MEKKHYKGNAELNSRVIRISLDSYNKLKLLCVTFNKTFAELVDYEVVLLGKKLNPDLKEK